MSRAILAAAFFGVASASLVYAAPALTGFKSRQIELPTGDRMFPAGPGADTINGNCLTCHSAGMVMTQPPLSRKVWESEVQKMRSVYKAPIVEDDVKPIVDYLTRIKGTD